MKGIRICFYFCFLFPGLLVAQTKEIIFNHFTVNDGISQSSVSCILQDAEGYIWFGSQNGLNKFNGYSFEKYYPNSFDSTSLSHGWIYSIAEDKEGNIWIGTRKGLNKFDKKKASFEQIANSANDTSIISHKPVYGVAYHEGQLLINTPPVLSIMDVHNRHMVHYTTNIDIEKKTGSPDRGYPVLVDKQKNCWVASPKGLSRFDLSTKKFHNYFYSQNDTTSIPDNYINTLYEDKQGDLWIGTANGFCRYDLKNDKFIRFKNVFKSNSILSILQDSNGNFWFGTFNGGLNVATFDNKKTTLIDFTNHSNDINNENTLINDIISSLYEDLSHILWAGSFTGMNTLDLKPKKFQLYKKTKAEHSINLLDNFVASAYKDKNNILWIGNWGKGLNLLNCKTGQVTHYAPDLQGKHKIVNGFVHVIFKDPDDNMWIATRNGIQVFQFTDSSFIDLNVFLKTSDLPEFRNTRVRKLYKDSNKNIWIGSNKGLYKIDRTTKKIHEYLTNDSPTSISDNLIYDIQETKEGKFWIGTVNGLNLFDPSTNAFTRYFNDPHNLKSLSSSMIIGLLLDRDGDLWIGTNCGLNLLKNGSTAFIHYSKKDGLPDDYIYNLVEDKYGKIWFSTNGGVGSINKKTKEFSSFSNEDGLQGLEFAGGSYFKSPDGEIFFGGHGGLNVFNPNFMPVNNFVPPIVITSFEKSNDQGREKRIVHNGDVIELSYNDHEIVIEFAALDYTNSKANRYAYKMQGLSKEWISTGNRNFVTFSKLPPDKYIFTVRGSNNDKIWNMKGATITIIIHPPFWKTWWFYTLCGLLIVSGIVILFKLREKNLLNEKKLLEQKVKERTEEVVYQHQQIEKQKDELNKKNIKITDSINYAKQIQDSFLPSYDKIKQVFPESFVLFMPKDIVSGDFYWLHTKTDQILFAAADCTGHGVPGAFMSLISINLLNEIVDRKTTAVPAELLDMLRQQLITSFTSKKGQEKRQDGLDIALCSYDPKTKILSYAGAKNSLYLFKNNVFKEIKADRQTVGKFYDQEKNEFTNHSFPVEKGDVIYLFTDGFADQKGGPDNKKYYYLPFQELCASIQQLSMDEQRQKLEEAFTSWRGTNEQIDDVLIIGIRF